MDYKSFVDGQKTLIIAPAGYGKTYTIAECLKYTEGKQLVLTHTHAGVASIKEKIKKAEIDPSTYSVETISSFSQKYVHAFYIGSEMPDQDDAKDYHPFVIQEATSIFKSEIVKKVVRKTYSGLFVDEYQDCTKDQHKMIVALANVLPTHILGDPLQGIFDFNNDAVVFEDDLSEFEEFPELSTPYRWCQEGNNKELGDIIKGFREALINEYPIALNADNDNGFHVISVQPNDFRDATSDYRKGIKKLLNNPENNPDYNSLLLIVPEYEETRNGRRVPKGGIDDRANIRAQIDYSKSLRLLEAIDDRKFYSLSKKTDELISKIGRSHKPIKKIKNDILESLFNKTALDEWFNEEALKQKRAQQDKEKSDKVELEINEFLAAPSAKSLLGIIREIKFKVEIQKRRDCL